MRTATLPPIRLQAPLREVRLRGMAASAGRSAEESAAELRAAYERGRLDGERALSEQLLRQRQETQELLQGVMESLRAAVPQVVRDTEQTMVTLALEMARKLVGDLPISVEMVEAAVQEALAQIEHAAEYTVQLHPADLELLRHSASPILADPTEGRAIRFQASSDVTRGGCLVQTRFGLVDARRETKFDLLKRSLQA